MEIGKWNAENLLSFADELLEVELEVEAKMDVVVAWEVGQCENIFDGTTPFKSIFFSIFYYILILTLNFDMKYIKS